MTNPRKPLRLNVGFLINSPIGVSRDFFFDSLSVVSEDGVAIQAIEGFAKISRTPQGLFVEGDFSGEIHQECARCLVDYLHKLRWNFAELYAFSRDNITDAGLLVPEDAQIDLQSLVHDFALVEVPITSLCKPDCRGLCMECGQNLNEQDCGHRPPNDSPFSVLKDLLESKD